MKNFFGVLLCFKTDLLSHKQRKHTKIGHKFYDYIYHHSNHSVIFNAIVFL